MISKYLSDIGMGEMTPGSMALPERSFLQEVLAVLPASLSSQEIDSLYAFPVPAGAEEGTCSTGQSTTFNLRSVYGLLEDHTDIAHHPMTYRLWRLNRLVRSLHAASEVDWLGIYRRVQKADGSFVLLKEAYFGAISRAEFPLTPQFAQNSINSTVGLNGRAFLINDVETFEGPYYLCDPRVRSELCLPIFDKSGQVIGIIDAESFHKYHFTRERAVFLAKVCEELGQLDLLRF